MKDLKITAEWVAPDGAPRKISMACDGIDSLGEYFGPDTAIQNFTTSLGELLAKVIARDDATTPMRSASEIGGE